ncbi:hypothetical protein SAMN05421752_12511 [Natronorubrum thiooxidans]|uniref:Uncharacterized protein n=1 Tax=Natronorubrum thiooxidans TaxID=308853 RepID=A0A1N7H4U7_9EURY|nr:hypothetical protein SAMN05421752_12511 [Natronorubrum thiooxidans]
MLVATTRRTGARGTAVCDRAGHVAGVDRDDRDAEIGAQHLESATRLGGVLDFVPEGDDDRAEMPLDQREQVLEVVIDGRRRHDEHHGFIVGNLGQRVARRFGILVQNDPGCIHELVFGRRVPLASNGRPAEVAARRPVARQRRHEFGLADAFLADHDDGFSVGAFALLRRSVLVLVGHSSPS